MVLETHMKLCMTQLNFLGKFIFGKKKHWEYGPKIGFFEIIETFGH